MMIFNRVFSLLLAYAMLLLGGGAVAAMEKKPLPQQTKEAASKRSKEDRSNHWKAQRRQARKGWVALKRGGQSNDEEAAGSDVEFVDAPQGGQGDAIISPELRPKAAAVTPEILEELAEFVLQRPDKQPVSERQVRLRKLLKIAHVRSQLEKTKLRRDAAQKARCEYKKARENERRGIADVSSSESSSGSEVDSDNEELAADLLPSLPTPPQSSRVGTPMRPQNPVQEEADLEEDTLVEPHERILDDVLAGFENRFLFSEEADEPGVIEYQDVARINDLNAFLAGVKQTSGIYLRMTALTWTLNRDTVATLKVDLERKIRAMRHMGHVLIVDASYEEILEMNRPMF